MLYRGVETLHVKQKVTAIAQEQIIGFVGAIAYLAHIGLGGVFTFPSFNAGTAFLCWLYQFVMISVATTRCIPRGAVIFILA
jgi:hypothetical protein